MVRTKVFVGNLSFKTQNADLAREFEVAGKVATANIISRGSRSLGYGFVEFETLEEANKSVELLNKKLIDNREINVEVARPRDETAPREPRAPRPRRTSAPRAPRQNQGNNNNGAAPAGAEGQQSPAQQGGERRPPRARKPRPPRRVPGAPGGAEGAAAAPKEGGANPNPRPRRPRQPRPAGDRPPRVASANTLFVANLPFSVDDAGLAEIFAGLNLKSAHVVRKRNDRSKGFGFVEFNNEQDQHKALAAVDKKKVEERELIVKIAVTGENQPKEAGAASPKPAAAAPAANASPKTN